MGSCNNQTAKSVEYFKLLQTSESLLDTQDMTLNLNLVLGSKLNQ